jgi:hypothetical protein
MIADFPQNYRLFAHVRNTAAARRNKASNPANLERADCYMYGHPDGPKKRYRSPAEFFHHMYWLYIDMTQDRINCTCKVCAPDELVRSASPIARQ